MAMDRRPENMERITTPALAQAFIDEQIADLRCPAAWILLLWPPC